MVVESSIGGERCTLLTNTITPWGMVEREYKYIILLFIYSLYHWSGEMVERGKDGGQSQSAKSG